MVGGTDGITVTVRAGNFHVLYQHHDMPLDEEIEEVNISFSDFVTEVLACRANTAPTIKDFAQLRKFLTKRLDMLAAIVQGRSHTLQTHCLCTRQQVGL